MQGVELAAAAMANGESDVDGSSGTLAYSDVVLNSNQNSRESWACSAEGSQGIQDDQMSLGLNTVESSNPPSPGDEDASKTNPRRNTSHCQNLQSLQSVEIPDRHFVTALALGEGGIIPGISRQIPSRINWVPDGSASDNGMQSPHWDIIIPGPSVNKASLQRFGTSSEYPHEDASTHSSIPPLVNDDDEPMPPSDNSDIEIVANRTSGTCRNETEPSFNDDHDEPPRTSAMLDAVMDCAANTAPAATSPSALTAAADAGSGSGADAPPTPGQGPTNKGSIQGGGLPGEGDRGAVSADALVTSPVKKQKKNTSNESSKGQKRLQEYFAPESKERAAFEDPMARIVDDMQRTSRTPFATAMLPHVKQILTGLKENGIQLLQYQDGDSYANKIACQDRNGQIFSLLLGTPIHNRSKCSSILLREALYTEAVNSVRGAAQLLPELIRLPGPGGHFMGQSTQDDETGMIVPFLLYSVGDGVPFQNVWERCMAQWRNERILSDEFRLLWLAVMKVVCACEGYGLYLGSVISPENFHILGPLNSSQNLLDVAVRNTGNGVCVADTKLPKPFSSVSPAAQALSRTLELKTFSGRTVKWALPQCWEELSDEFGPDSQDSPPSSPSTKERQNCAKYANASAQAAAKMLVDFFRTCPQDEGEKNKWQSELQAAKTNPALMQRFLQGDVASGQPLALQRAADLLCKTFGQEGSFATKDILNHVFSTLPILDPDSDSALRGEDGIIIPGGPVKELIWVQERFPSKENAPRPLQDFYDKPQQRLLLRHNPAVGIEVYAGCDLNYGDLVAWYAGFRVEIGTAAETRMRPSRQTVKYLAGYKGLISDSLVDSQHGLKLTAEWFS